MLGAEAVPIEIIKAEDTIKTPNEICLRPVTEFSIAEAIRRIEELNGKLGKI